MALVKTVELRILAAAGDAQAQLDRAAAKADQLDGKAIRMRFRLEDGDAKAQLDAIRAKADRLGFKDVEIKVKVDGAGRAVAELAAVRHEEEKAGLGKTLSGLSGPGLLGPALMALPAIATLGGVAAGAVLGLGGAAVAGGTALAAFGGVAKPVLTDAKTAAAAVEKAQSNYNVAIAAGTKHAAAYKAEQIAVGKAYAGMSPQQVALSRQLGSMSSAWKDVKAAQTPVVAGALQPWLKSVTDLTKNLAPVISHVSPAIKSLGGQFDGLIGSSAFKGFRDFAAGTGTAVVSAGGGALINALKGTMQLLPQFDPLIREAAAGISHLGTSFASWSGSAKGADQIQGFLRWFSANGPAVTGLMKNIGGAMKTLMPGLTAGGVGELNAISGFFGLLAKLPKGIAAPLAETAGVLLSLQKIGVLKIGIKITGAALKWLTGGVISIGSGASAAAEMRAAFAAGGAAAAAEIRAAMAGGGAAAGAGAAAGRAAGGAGATGGAGAAAMFGPVAVGAAAGLALGLYLKQYHAQDHPPPAAQLGPRAPQAPSQAWKTYDMPAPKPVKVPAPDLSQFTSTIAQAMSKTQLKPVKLPAPDVSQFDTALSNAMARTVTKAKPLKLPAPDVSAFAGAKAGATAAANGIRTAAEGPLKKPVKMAAPDLSAPRAAAGAARGIGMSISGGLAAGIESGKGAAVAAAADVANAVTAAMAHAAQARSPSRVTEKLGGDIALGLLLGLRGSEGEVSTRGNAIMNSLMTGIGATVPALKKQLDGIAKTIRSQIAAATAYAGQVTSTALGAGGIINAASAAGSAPAAATFAASDLTTGMQSQITGLKQFTQQIRELKKEGLNKTSLGQIIGAGVSGGLPVAQALTAGGKDAVKQVNELQKELAASAKQLGVTSATAMFDSGAAAGQGLVSGLKSQLGAVVAAIRQLAQSMVAAAKATLKIHSPSLEFRELGQWSGAGLILGLGDSRRGVEAAGQRLARAAAGSYAPAMAGAAMAGPGLAGRGGGTGDIHLHFEAMVHTQDSVKQAVQAFAEYKRHGGGAPLGIA